MERRAAEQAGCEDSVPRQPDMRLPRRLRITDSPQFKEAFDQGRKVVGSCMVLWLRSGSGANLRLGAVASRKSFRRSVDRSLARRHLREAFRRIRHRLQGKVDVILLARPALLTAKVDRREKELLALLKRAGILKPEIHPGETACAGY